MSKSLKGLPATSDKPGEENSPDKINGNVLKSAFWISLGIISLLVMIFSDKLFLSQ